MRTANDEIIGNAITQQDTELERLEHLVVQVSKANTHIYPQRNTVTCYRCGEQGHIRTGCTVQEVYCNICRTSNQGTRACRRYNSPNDSPPNSNSSPEYHPTATPHQGKTNGLFAPTRTSTAVHSPIPGATNNPEPANITVAMTLASTTGSIKSNRRRGRE